MSDAYILNGLMDGTLVEARRSDLEWVHKWLLHGGGGVEQPCPKCGIAMPVNPGCGWICGNMACAVDGRPFGIEPYRIIGRILAGRVG